MSRLIEEKEREFRRAEYFTRKALISLLRLGAKQASGSSSPEAWANILAPIYKKRNGCGTSPAPSSAA